VSIECSPAEAVGEMSLSKMLRVMGRRCGLLIAGNRFEAPLISWSMCLLMIELSLKPRSVFVDLIAEL
jgi:hypothetical protein